MLTGMVNQDPRVQHLWQEVPCEGEVPTPEEFILWAAKKSLLAKKAGVRILFPAPVSMMVFRNIVVPYVDPHSPILISHGQQFRNGGAGKVFRRFPAEGQRKQRAFFKSATRAVDHEFLRVSGAVLSLVAGHGEIGAVPTERDMGDVDHRLTYLFFPLQCR